MATTIQQLEGNPASYPPRPTGLSAAALAIDSNMLWSRIENYTAYRFTPRSVIWVAEGPCDWTPPLAPATISTVEVWSKAGMWETATPDPSPLGGFFLPSIGPYRFTATVGGGDVPALVNEAYRRLAEYLACAAVNANPGMRQSTTEGIGSHTFDPTAIARALERSGAGDLLRSFRRAT